MKGDDLIAASISAAMSAEWQRGVSETRPATDEELDEWSGLLREFANDVVPLKRTSLLSMFARIDADRQEIERLRAEGAVLRKALEAEVDRCEWGGKAGNNCTAAFLPEQRCDGNATCATQQALTATPLIAAHLERFRALERVAEIVREDVDNFCGEEFDPVPNDRDEYCAPECEMFAKCAALAALAGVEHREVPNEPA